MKQTNTAKRPAIFVTLNDCKLVSCDRQLLSCDRKLISCDRQLLSCDRKLISCGRKLVSCDRKLVSCDRKLISCDRKLVSCDRKLATCDEKNRCVPYEPPYEYGVFPSKFYIVPIYKSDVETDPNNYRPISLLSIFNRIFEEMMQNDSNHSSIYR